MNPLARIWTGLGALLVLGSVGAAQEPVTPAPEAPAPAVLSRWTPDEEAALRLLRALRRKERPPEHELVASLSLPGETLLPLLFEVLERRNVPALDGGEDQVLSEIQETILLRTFETYDRETVLSYLEPRLSAGAELRLRHAAILAIGHAGRPNDLMQLFELALPTGELALEKPMAKALERAVTVLVQRVPATIDMLVQLRRITRPELLPRLIEAVGAAGDPRGLAYLADVLYWAEPLALDVLSQVPRLGPSGDVSLDEPLRARLRVFLSSDRPGHGRAAITALTALGDLESIGAFIALLSSEDRGLRENAHWGLKELTGLSFSATPETWSRWHQSELSWMVRARAREFHRLQQGDAAEAADALRTILSHPFARGELCATLPELLKSRHVSLRELACRTLGELEVVEATEKLVWTLEDPVVEVRQAAHAALRRLTRLDLPLEPVAWQGATGADPRGSEL